MNRNNEAYQNGGTLRYNHPYYIEREADSTLYKSIKNGEYCTLIAPRQMGKSSLINRTGSRLKVEGYKCCFIDMTIVTSTNCSIDNWYISFLDAIVFELFLDVDITEWWHRIDFPPDYKFLLFVNEFIIQDNNKVVFFLDEIDVLIASNIDRNSFFAAIRSLYNKRAIHCEYENICFVFSGVASIYDLMPDKHQTPFNICTIIQLRNLNISQTEKLVSGLELPKKQCRRLANEIYKWTNGVPVLVQDLCKELQNINRIDNETQIVEQIIRQRYITSTRMRPVHFQTIEDILLKHPEHNLDILNLYLSVISGKNIVAKYTDPACVQLLLTGLVIEKDNLLTVNNKIYEQIFNEQWINIALEKSEKSNRYKADIAYWIQNKKSLSALPYTSKEKEIIDWYQSRKQSFIETEFVNACNKDIRRRQKKLILIFALFGLLFSVLLAYGVYNRNIILDKETEIKQFLSEKKQLMSANTQLEKEKTNLTNMVDSIKIKMYTLNDSVGLLKLLKQELDSELSRKNDALSTLALNIKNNEKRYEDMKYQNEIIVSQNKNLISQQETLINSLKGSMQQVSKQIEENEIDILSPKLEYNGDFTIKVNKVEINKDDLFDAKKSPKFFIEKRRECRLALYYYENPYDIAENRYNEKFDLSKTTNEKTELNEIGWYKATDTLAIVKLNKRAIYKFVSTSKNNEAQQEYINLY